MSRPDGGRFEHRDEEYDKAAVDRAFAALVAGYHLTAEPRRSGEADDPRTRDLGSTGAGGAAGSTPPAPTPTSTPASTPASTPTPAPTSTPPGAAASGAGGPSTAARAGDPPEIGRRIGHEVARTEDGELDSRWADQHPLFSFTEFHGEPEEIEERYEPPPPPPWPRPSAALLVGWIGVAFAVITMIAAALGAPIPRWTAWTALGSFVGGFALLLSRLPRQRPPGNGDGAVI